MKAFFCRNMNIDDILIKLKSLGNESTVNIFKKHGAKDPIWGVKVADLKPFVKDVKKDQELAKNLFNSGVSDAMYLAGLCTDGSKMTEDELQDWVEKANWYMLSEYTVPWVAAEHPNAVNIGLRWIDSDKEPIASSGWSLLSGLALCKPDSELDIDLYRKLLKRVEQEIKTAPNRVRYAMNGFVISAGICLVSLSNDSILVANKIGKVSVNMGDTACKVPFAPDYIQKSIDMGRLGKKKKTLKC